MNQFVVNDTKNKAKSISPLTAVDLITKKDRIGYQTALLTWFKKNCRTFPWRETTNPYFILISEFLLQKTNSRAVPDIYLSFISTFPTPHEVANAKIKEIKFAIAPLGLEYRAERIKLACVSIISQHSGKVPSNLNELMALKGVGRYIASAVCLFAFKQPLGIVDQNVIRVLSRVFKIQSPKKRPHTDSELWEAAQALVPQKKARDYNLGVLDLAALICRPKPLCEFCPLNDLCRTVE